MKFKQTIIEMEKWIILVLVAILSYWGINNLDKITSFLTNIYNVLFPFILGGVIAFILNIPMSFIEKKLKNNFNLKKNFIRGISIMLSLLLFSIVVLFVAFLLVPELIENIQLLISNVPILFENVENFAIELLDKYPDIQLQIKDFFNNSGNLGNILTSVLNYFLNGAIGFIGNFISGMVTIFTALVFSIYMLSQKEYLVRVSKKIIYAITSKEKADKCVDIGNLANKTFSKFISGQCVEAIILGSIIFVVCSILRFPYALVISVLTSITALIPIFGAIIAMCVGAILIGINSPLQAILFIAVYQIVQQIENNFIYPKVVGKSVGLSPMWTLLAISVGGSLFGIVGMILGLPLASVIYVLVKEIINNKLNEKKIVVK